MDRPDLGAPDLRIHYIRVTNNLDVPFTDRWDGIPVTIPVGKSENLQLDMANHFFGYYYEVERDVMFRHTCKRQGWNTPAHVKEGDDGKTLAQRNFAALDIKAVVYKMVEETIDTDQPIPADPVLPKVADIPDLPPRKSGAK